MKGEENFESNSNDEEDSDDYNPIPEERELQVTCIECKLVSLALFELQEVSPVDHSTSNFLYFSSELCKKCNTPNNASYDRTYDVCKTDCSDQVSDDDSMPEENTHDFSSDTEDVENASFSSVNQGKGDCSILVVGQCLIIYDFGFKKEWPTLEKILQTLIPHIPQPHFAILILSHNDKDHKGNLENTIEFLNDQQFKVYLIARENENHMQVTNILSTDNDILSIHLSKNFYIKVHCPPNNGNENKKSLVAVIGNKDKIVVLTGDQYQDIIKKVLYMYKKKSIDLYQFPHHASLKQINDDSFSTSKYYLVSGTPLYDQNSNNNRGRNASCQIFCLKTIVKKKIQCTLILTQPRLSPEMTNYAAQNNIKILEVESCESFSLLG
ncbi:hypothetical protein CYY_008431 [Polysphondylium violaceum]|uniref:Metallo-beta-lactamase domain-containing protein n=1 Tax=Polysphondylium violaceum TaxID=133409 RepID=A0A8J4PMZ8_9MYCE|nr:hypothetical protein CYY_008431 [Polysphondylium violaceum]